MATTRELAEEVARQLVSDLDIENKLEEKTRQLMRHCGQLMKEVKADQAQANVQLGQAMEECREAQQGLREENHKLMEVVHDLVTALATSHPAGVAAAAVPPGVPVPAPVPPPGTMPPGTLAPQAVRREAAQRMGHMPPGWYPGMVSPASAAAASASAAVAAATAAAAAQPPRLLGGGACQFTVTLRRADKVSLGLTLTPSDEALLIEGIAAGGAVEAWNRQCHGDVSQEARGIAKGDRIVAVNGISGDIHRMCEQCHTKQLLRLTIVRGSAGASTNSPSNATNTSQVTPPGAAAGQQGSMLRMNAPEFVPRELRTPSAHGPEPAETTTPPKVALPRRSLSALFESKDEAEEAEEKSPKGSAS